ncbi:MAG: hypothetical protein LBF68_01305 [Christensenellaceae bacterium]|jgi:hypothetical protein|nr:hypothetical protein [Christensenellaceae bacterium]
MGIDLRGINNYEYYTNYYLNTSFKDDLKDIFAKKTKSALRKTIPKTPWKNLQSTAKAYFEIRDNYVKTNNAITRMLLIMQLANNYLKALEYDISFKNDLENIITVSRDIKVPVYFTTNEENGIWVLLVHPEKIANSDNQTPDIFKRFIFDTRSLKLSTGEIKESVTIIPNGEMFEKIFRIPNPPRFLVCVTIDGLYLFDKKKWFDRKYIYFNNNEIFNNASESTYKIVTALLHNDYLNPLDKHPRVDKFTEASKKQFSSLKYKFKNNLREVVEILGKEVLYYNKHYEKKSKIPPFDSETLTINCLEYLFRLLVILVLESKKEYDFCSKETAFAQSYTIDGLMDLLNEDSTFEYESKSNNYANRTLTLIFKLMHNALLYSVPNVENTNELANLNNMHMTPLIANLFDYTKTASHFAHIKIRVSTIRNILNKLAVIRDGDFDTLISYKDITVEEIIDIFEEFLLYTGTIVTEKLYEVKNANDKLGNDLAGYFVGEDAFKNYNQNEHVYRNNKLAIYNEGEFVFRQTIKTFNNTASFTTPRPLIQTIVRYALKELFLDKNADDILNLKICDPAMGCGLFLNEAVNQIATAYLIKKQEELNEIIADEKEFVELQRVKTYIIGRNIYGLESSTRAYELAKHSISFNAISDGNVNPSFGLNLRNANSLVGARLFVVKVPLMTKGYFSYFKSGWIYTQIKKGRTRKNDEIYAFLLGDINMCNSNEIIHSYDDDIQTRELNDWDRSFRKDYTDAQVKELLYLSDIIDDLWDEHCKLQQKLIYDNTCNLDIFGKRVKESDICLNNDWKDELTNGHDLNEFEGYGDSVDTAYEILKFIMDYWCALWYWPSNKTNKLPTESGYLLHIKTLLTANTAGKRLEKRLKNILLGQHHTENITTNAGTETQYNGVTKKTIIKTGQKKLSSRREGVDDNANSSDRDMNTIKKLALKYPAVKVVCDVAAERSFFHWDLEFADVFNTNGGFDLVLGNPPWKGIKPSEKAILSLDNPMVLVRRNTLEDIAKIRVALKDDSAKSKKFISAYRSDFCFSNFISYSYNSYILSRVQMENRHDPDIYMYFLNMSFDIVRDQGVISYLLPEDIWLSTRAENYYDRLYSKLRYRFLFEDANKEFSEIHFNNPISINIFSKAHEVYFECINNLRNPTQIYEFYDCYENMHDYNEKKLTTLETENDLLEMFEKAGRIVKIGKNELRILASFDKACGVKNWKRIKLPEINNIVIIDVLSIFDNHKRFSQLDRIENININNDVDKQLDISIEKYFDFPLSINETVLTKYNIDIANSIAKCVDKDFKSNRDYSCVNLGNIPDDFLPRVHYRYKKIDEEKPDNSKKASDNSGGVRDYCITGRADQSSDRALVCCLIPAGMKQTDSLFTIHFKRAKDLLLSLGCFMTIPYDFLIKFINAGTEIYNDINRLPLIDSKYSDAIIGRALLLNCVTKHYSNFWKVNYNHKYFTIKWAKEDSRLNNDRFNVTNEWNRNTPLRSDFERRQALIELDVLASMALGITLEQLKVIYRIYFETFKKNDEGTWYDQKGKMIYTSNSALVTAISADVRDSWADVIRLKRGSINFSIEDSTLTSKNEVVNIDYYPPFSCCDREKDYDITWTSFKNSFTE